MRKVVPRELYGSSPEAIRKRWAFMLEGIPPPEKPRTCTGGSERTPPDPSDLWPARGAKLWSRLHTDALHGTLTQAIVQGVIGQLPCGECRSDARMCLKASPLPDDAAEHPEWVRRWHNAVNKKLGRREWTVEEARERWVNVGVSA